MSGRKICRCDRDENKGQIMKAVMADMKGKADGKVINQVVAELCK